MYVLYLFFGLIITQAVIWTVDDEFDPSVEDHQILRSIVFLTCVALWPIVLVLLVVDLGKLVKRKW